VRRYFLTFYAHRAAGKSPLLVPRLATIDFILLWQFLPDRRHCHFSRGRIKGQAQWPFVFASARLVCDVVHKSVASMNYSEIMHFSPSISIKPQSNLISNVVKVERSAQKFCNKCQVVTPVVLLPFLLAEGPYWFWEASAHNTEKFSSEKFRERTTRHNDTAFSKTLRAWNRTFPGNGPLAKKGAAYG
jgi:hypothetical protein